MAWGTSLKNNVEATFSIKKRLTISVIALSSVLILICLYFSFSYSKHEIEEVYDARLGQSAKMLLLSMPISEQPMQSEHTRELFDNWMKRIALQAKGDDDPTPFGHPYEQHILVQFYIAGELIWSSIPEIGNLNHDPKYAGFGYMDIENEPWRYFQLPLPKAMNTKHEYIFVAEKESIRDEMMYELALSAAVPQFVLIPSLALLMVLLIDKHFKPITELKRAIAQRSANKLDSIYVANPTQELSPLVAALNTLLSELEQAWQREKRFTRMAAHELKTPLTILRLNAENALMSQNEQQLKSDLNNILQGIDRTDRMIQQLLTLAKVESIHEMKFLVTDLSKLCQSVIAERVPLALKRKQEVSFEGDEIQVLGDEALLRMLLTNLLDNAMRYSGEGSQINIRLEDKEESVNVYVSDTGKNISAETREKMFDNFYRANTEKGDGAGLGMSITRDIARLHGGSVELLPRAESRNTFLVVLPK